MDGKAQGGDQGDGRRAAETHAVDRIGAGLIAHEMRGPLGVLHGYASMLLDGSLDRRPDYQRQAAEAMVRKAHELSTLFDWLVVSLAGGDGRERVDLREVVRQAVERTADRADLEATSVTAIGADPESQPVVVDVNRAHLLCILTCLLGNAFVYSPRPATVVVELRNVDPAQVAVQDYGLGIPEARQAHVFERECRLCEGVDGFGLGLALSRDLAERNGGSLTLESSRVGKGSTFVLALPRVN
jgi:signal transduction histidine kinase